MLEAVEITANGDENHEILKKSATNTELEANGDNGFHEDSDILHTETLHEFVKIVETEEGESLQTAEAEVTESSNVIIEEINNDEDHASSDFSEDRPLIELFNEKSSTEEEITNYLEQTDHEQSENKEDNQQEDNEQLLPQEGQPELPQEVASVLIRCRRPIRNALSPTVRSEPSTPSASLSFPLLRKAEAIDSLNTVLSPVLPERKRKLIAEECNEECNPGAKRVKSRWFPFTWWQGERREAVIEVGNEENAEGLMTEKEEKPKVVEGSNGRSCLVM